MSSLGSFLQFCLRLPNVLAQLSLNSIGVTELHTVFQYYFFIFSIYCYSYSVFSLSKNCYSSLHKNVRITVATDTWLQHYGLEFDLTICVVCSMCIIILFSLVFCSEFRWLNISIIQKIFDILILHSLPIYLWL